MDGLRTGDEPGDWPAYCCAIVRDARGRYLLERRPRHTPDAPGRLTCFGGTRERGEAPDACLVRELREELGWTVEIGMFELAVRLVNEGAPIVRRTCSIPTGGTVAWFYRARDVAISSWPVRTEEGYLAEWREWDAGLESELGLWHRLPLRVEREGGMVAVLRE